MSIFVHFTAQFMSSYNIESLFFRLKCYPLFLIALHISVSKVSLKKKEQTRKEGRKNNSCEEQTLCL